MKLMIGVPATWESLPTDFVISYTGLFRPQHVTELKAEGVETFQQAFGRAFPLDYCRNMIVRNAIAAGMDALIFLDADMIFPNDTLVRLVRQFKAHPNAGIISGLYFKKAWPFYPVASNWCINQPQHMFPIAVDQPIETADVVGMGCAIIRLSVVKAMPQPWFEYRRDLVRGEDAITEDVAFCDKVRAAGALILSDNELICGHLMKRVVNMNDYHAGLREIEKRRAQQKEIEANALTHLRAVPAVE